MPGKQVGQCRVTPLRFKYIGKRGLGFRVEGLGLRVEGLGFEGLGFRV